MKLKLILISLSSTFVVIHGGDQGSDWGDVNTSRRTERHVSHKFEYGVGDPQTNDYKSQYEHREGDYVEGMYELKEADGTKRIVKYRAGPGIGFEAMVEKVGHAVHPASGGGGYGGGYKGYNGGFGGYGGSHGFLGVGGGYGGFGGIGGSSYVGPTHWGSHGLGGYGGFGGFGGHSGFGVHGGFGGLGGFLHKL